MKMFLKRKPLMVLPIILTVMVIVYGGCKKEGSTDSAQLTDFIEDARSWFRNEIISKEKRLLAASYSDLAKDDRVRILSRMVKISKLLKWNNGKYFEVEGIQYAVVPVEQALKPIKNQNYEGGRGVVFYKDRTGKMQMNIIEVISKKGEILGEPIIEICANAFLNKILDKSFDIKNTNLNILFYNERYHHETSFQTIDGRWARAKIQINNRKGSAGNKRIVSTMSRAITCQSCTTWYTVGVWYDLHTGEVVDFAVLDEWDECFDRGLPPGYGDGGELVYYDCEDACLAAANSMWDGVQVVSETVNIDVGAIDHLRKYKNPKWRILKNLTWSLYSQENGVVKLIDPQTDTWQWESLSHGTITFEGVSVGGSITHDNGFGTPSFFPGTSNVFFGGMSLNFNVTYSPACSDCPVVGQGLKRSVGYTSNGMWPAKP